MSCKIFFSTNHCILINKITPIHFSQCMRRFGSRHALIAPFRPTCCYLPLNSCNIWGYCFKPPLCRLKTSINKRCPGNPGAASSNDRQQFPIPSKFPFTVITSLSTRKVPVPLLNDYYQWDLNFKISFRIANLNLSINFQYKLQCFHLLKKFLNHGKIGRFHTIK